MDALEQFKNDKYFDQINEDRSFRNQSINIPIVPNIESIKKLSNEKKDKSLEILKKKSTNVREHTKTTLININKNKTNTLAENLK